MVRYCSFLALGSTGASVNIVYDISNRRRARGIICLYMNKAAIHADIVDAYMYCVCIFHEFTFTYK